MEDQRITGNEDNKEKLAHKILLLFSVVLFLAAVIFYVSVFMKPARVIVEEHAYDAREVSDNSSAVPTETTMDILASESPVSLSTLPTPSVTSGNPTPPSPVFVSVPNVQISNVPKEAVKGNNPATTAEKTPAKPEKPPVINKQADYPVHNSSVKKADGQEKTNINTATIEELDKLPYIGKKKAKKILEYRQKNGKFVNPEDIIKVEGIGEGIYRKIKDRIKT